jgi:hypothetical protein
MKPDNRRDEGGMAVVAVIVLIAVLFLSGTVMALAVSSNLHTVSLATAQDAVHYAAESAVARGIGPIEVAAALKKPVSCPPDPLVGINGQDLKIRCHSQLVGGDLSAQAGDDDEGQGSGRASVPGGRLNPGACVPPISLPAKMTAWTVVGWRGSGTVKVWTTAPGQGCQSSAASPCDPTLMFATVVYFSCGAQTTDRILYIGAGVTGPVDLGTAVLRWAPKGPRVLWTVVGTAGFEVDEADVLLPKQQVLWNTVLS